MRKLLIVLIILPIFGIAQNKGVSADTVGANYKYTSIIQATGTARELFNKSMEWISNQNGYDSGNKYIDSASNKIIQKILLSKDTYCTVTIETKDNRARIMLDDFVTASNGKTYNLGIDMAILDSMQPKEVKPSMTKEEKRAARKFNNDNGLILGIASLTKTVTENGRMLAKYDAINIIKKYRKFMSEASDNW